MSIQRVYSKNAAYQKFEELKTNRNKRYRYNAFFVEGVRNINEAIANGWTIQSFLYCPDRALSHWAQDILHTVRTEVNYELSDALMRELSGKEDTSELLAVVQMRDDRLEDVKLSDNPVIALLRQSGDRTVRPAVQQGQSGHDHPLLRFLRAGLSADHRPCRGSV